MAMKSYTPFRYPGGKAKLYDNFKKIINDYDLQNCTYIEPFCGGAGLALKLLLKGDIKNIILNDIDRSIYSVWYCILNYTEKLCEVVETIEISIEERKKQKIVQNLKNDAELFDLAISTIYLNRVNRSGILNAGVIGGNEQTGNYKMDCRFNKEYIVKIIKEIAERKNDIAIYNEDVLDFIDIIKNDIGTNSLFYLDPPYFNQGPNLYTNFYTYEDHKILSEKIKELDIFHWIVTYDNTPEIFEIYKKYEPEIYSITYSTHHKYQGSEIMISNMGVSFC